VNFLQPGAGVHANPASIDTKGIAAYTAPGKMKGTVDFLMDIIPNTVVDAFAKGEILQVLLFAVLFGFALHRFGGRGTLVFDFIEKISHVLFQIVNMIMRVAPLGAFGAMAFTVGKFGLGSLFSLGKLMGAYYLTWLLFIFVVLGLIARVNGFSIFKFVRYIKEELLIVLGTSSSESVLPRMMEKMEVLGAKKIGGGPGHSNRLLLQSGWHLNLPDHGSGLHCSGHRYPVEPDATARFVGCAAVDFQGGGRGDGQRLHCAGRYAVFSRRRAGGRLGPDFGD